MGINSAPGNGTIEDNDKLAKEVMETFKKFPDINRTELYDKVVRHYLKNSYSTIFADIEESKKEEPIKDTIPFGDYMKIFKLVYNPNTPRETLELILTEINKLYHNEHQIDEVSYKDDLKAISLNPNTDPKLIEKNIENILNYSYNSGTRGYDRGFDIFLTRPDLTPETIQKISNYIKLNDSTGFSEISTLIYNPNISKELLETLLKNKSIRELINRYQKIDNHVKEYCIAIYPELLKEKKE